MRIDRHTSSVELVEIGFLMQVSSGRLPHTHAVRLDNQVAPAQILGPQARLLRTAVTDGVTVVLAEDDDGVVCVRTNADGCTIRVAAGSPDAAARRCRDLAAGIEQRPPVDTVPIRVWHRSGPLGATARDRAIDASPWSSIRRNYPAATRRQIDWLHHQSGPVGTGRLILWHGAPGTGKTTAARSLFRSWSQWCSVEYVSDPEQLLADPGYMNEVIGRPTSKGVHPGLHRISPPQERWRLVVAEDIDRVLDLGRTAASSPGLGRLLNLADGILGQGTRTLVLLTANTPADRFDPALTRPGRAFASIEFNRFSRTEATDWLGRSPKAGELTLAELYHLNTEHHPDSVAVDERASTGLYV